MFREKPYFAFPLEANPDAVGCRFSFPRKVRAPESSEPQPPKMVGAPCKESVPTVCGVQDAQYVPRCGSITLQYGSRVGDCFEKASLKNTLISSLRIFHFDSLPKKLKSWSWSSCPDEDGSRIVFIAPPPLYKVHHKLPHAVIPFSWGPVGCGAPYPKERAVHL